MQWMITYGLRPEGTWRGYDDNLAGLLATFADWTPPEGVEIVMFVHREEYYHRGDEAEQYAGQAEIIIAKQRNGPVGDVELMWEKQFTRFQDKAPERMQEFDDYNDGFN